MLVTLLAGWLRREQHEVIQYLRKENRVLKARLHTRRVRFTDDERRRCGERQTSWQAFLRAHWNAFVAADFFTTEVWTLHGLLTYYTLFVIELHSRRVHLVGSTPNPDEAFMLQIARHLTDANGGVLGGSRSRVLICDRDRKWSAAVQDLLESSGVHVIRTVSCTQLQCVRGAVCSLNKRGMPRSTDSSW